LKSKFLKLSFILGIFILVVLFYAIGPEKILHNIRNLSLMGFFLLMLMRLFYWLLRTMGWKVILEKYESTVSLWMAFKARMLGHSVSQLTPTAHIGGETARIFFFNSSNRKTALASVVLDKTIEIMSTTLFVAISLILFVTRINVDSDLKLIYFVSLAGIFIFLAFLIYRQHKGLFSGIINFLDRLKIRFKFIEKHRTKIEETDRYISEFYTRHRRAFVKSMLLYSLLFLFWTAEIHLTLTFMGARNISFLDSFIITALGNLALFFPFIPASLGVHEITIVSVFALLGLGTDMGFSLVLIRRIISLLWAGIGLLYQLFPHSEPTAQVKEE